MPTDLATLKKEAVNFLEYTKMYKISSEESKVIAAGDIATANKKIKQLQALGKPNIDAAKEALSKIKHEWESHAQPLKEGKAILETKMKEWFVKEREAQKQLQQEELNRAHENQDLPQIVEGTTKTTKTEAGQVTVKEIKTYDVGDVIIDGKAVPEADLSRANPALKELPDELFTLDLSRLRTLALKHMLKADALKVYTKPSVSTREG